MQNRRNFLKQASMMLAGGLVVPQLLTSCGGGSGSSAAAASSKNIGLQLYSLREMVKDEGIQKVLEAVAKMGYKNLEAAGYNDGKLYDMEPGELKKMANDLGLKFTSSHVGQSFSKDKQDEIMSWWDKAIDAHDKLGVKYLVQPWMPITDETTLDDLKMYCDYFNAVGVNAAKNNIAFGYHNHDFEFRQVEGQVVYDFLLDNVSKNHVFFQMDVYWVMMGGADPVAYLKERPSQFKTIHIKDEKEIGASGKMNFQPIFEQMQANNIKDWYVEVEQYTNNDPQASVQESFNFLNNADYVK